MSKNIRLSNKNGLNPTIPVCFYCGQPKNEIALLGKIGKGKEDLEAPKHMVLDYEPCENCKKMMEGRILLIEVQETPFPDNRPAIQIQKTESGREMPLYPTGRLAGLKPEAANRIFNTTIDTDRVFIDGEVFENLMSRSSEANNKKQEESHEN